MDVITMIVALVFACVLFAGFHRLGLVVVGAPTPFRVSLLICAAANVALVIPYVGLLVAMPLLGYLTHKRTNVPSVVSAAIVTVITYFGTLCALVVIRMITMMLE